MNCRHLFISALFLLLSAGLYSQNNWLLQTSGTTTHLYGVCFADRYYGWAVGESGIIINTINGGKNWTTQASGVTTVLNSVYFADKQKGWAVGNSGKILYTSNGGANWSSQTSGTTEQLNSVFFIDDKNGWAVGAGGILLHTSNGGSYWLKQTSAVAPSSNGVCFIDRKTGWVVANMGRIIHTVDSGSNWVTQTSGTTFNLMGVHFPEENYGWAVGLNGTVVRTKNAGNTWSIQNSGITDALLDVHFTDTLNGWAVGISGKIIYTADGGVTWTVQNSGLTSNLRSIFFYRDSPGWIVGNDGKILYTKKTEEICLVSIDTMTYRYKIMWEKFGGMGTAYYNVYKETGTANYVLIGTVPFSDPAQFIDVNSHPENKEEKYKISAVDSQSVESAKSPYFKPIFMQASAGVPATNVNLDWNFYEDESGKYRPFWYYIYRGTTPGNMTKIDSVTGTSNKWTDVNVFTNYYYRVGFIKDSPCDVVNNRANTNSGPYSQSVSNLKDYAPPSIDYLQAYPDNILLTKEMQNLNIKVLTNLSVWNATTSETGWIVLTNDIANKSISAIITPNTGDNSRQGTITITASGQPNKIIDINQDGKITSIQKDLPTDDILIYQDPNSTGLVIVIPNKSLKMSTFELFNLSGKQLMKTDIYNLSLITIPVTGLSEGVYLLKLTGEKIITRKVYID